MDEFKPYVSLVQALRDPGMKDRHFEQLSAQTGIQMALKPSITFKSLLMLGIEEFEELVKTVADTAAKEYATERTLNRMIEEWETIVMEILAYKTTGQYRLFLSFVFVTTYLVYRYKVEFYRDFVRSIDDDALIRLSIRRV